MTGSQKKALMVRYLCHHPFWSQLPIFNHMHQEGVMGCCIWNYPAFHHCSSACCSATMQPPDTHGYCPNESKNLLCLGQKGLVVVEEGRKVLVSIDHRPNQSTEEKHIDLNGIFFYVMNLMKKVIQRFGLGCHQYMEYPLSSFSHFRLITGRL